MRNLVYIILGLNWSNFSAQLFQLVLRGQRRGERQAVPRLGPRTQHRFSQPNSIDPSPRESEEQGAMSDGLPHFHLCKRPPGHLRALLNVRQGQRFGKRCLTHCRRSISFKHINVKVLGYQVCSLKTFLMFSYIVGASFSTVTVSTFP